MEQILVKLESLAYTIAKLETKRRTTLFTEIFSDEHVQLKSDIWKLKYQYALLLEVVRCAK